MSVETDETFGFWSGGKAEGSYRLVLLQEGYEHLSHRLIIEWIGVSQASDRALDEQVELNFGKGSDPTGYAIAVTKIESSESGGATVHLDLVHPITMARQCVILKLGEPGVCESFWGAAAAHLNSRADATDALWAPLNRSVRFASTGNGAKIRIVVVSKLLML